jgi:predicted acyltransferase
MAQSTTARGTGRAAAGARGRNPELDATRALALVAAVVVLVAPAPLPTWLDGPGLSVAAQLPATFAGIAGVAVALQGAAHASAPVGWWAGRALRRVVVLVAVGLLLGLLTGLPAAAPALDGLLFSGTLARIGVATAIVLLLVRLPVSTRVVIAAVLVAAHGLPVLGVDGPAAGGGALAGWDARLLGGRALTPIDPDGITALAPTVALVLTGTVLGDWLRQRRRGAATVGLLLLVTAGLSATTWWTAALLPADPTIWSLPVLLGGLAMTTAGLAVGQAGTRRAVTDRGVAVLAAAGRVTLPLWVLAVLAEAWLTDTAPVRWLLRAVLWPPLGDTGAAIALGLLLGAGLLRLGGALADRDWVLRA